MVWSKNPPAIRKIQTMSSLRQEHLLCFIKSKQFVMSQGRVAEIERSRCRPAALSGRCGKCQEFAA